MLFSARLKMVESKEEGISSASVASSFSFSPLSLWVSKSEDSFPGVDGIEAQGEVDHGMTSAPGDFRGESGTSMVRGERGTLVEEAKGTTSPKGFINSSCVRPVPV